MIKRLLLGVTATVMVAGLAHAAEIKLEGKNADGIPVVSVKGDFIERDIERFADATKHLQDAVISFSSNGGSLSAGIEIGTRIRMRGYRTAVPDLQGCYSACALAWLGGTVRYIGYGAEVGFHAAYLKTGQDMKETGVGNAVVGAYATNLGLRTAAVIFLTSAPPDRLNIITKPLALQVGIIADFGIPASLLKVFDKQDVRGPAQTVTPVPDFPRAPEPPKQQTEPAIPIREAPEAGCIAFHGERFCN